MSSVKLDDGSSVEVNHEPISYRDQHVFQQDNYLIVAYLAQDNGQDYFDEAASNLYTSAHKREKGEQEVQRALGFDSYWDKNYDLIDDDYLLTILKKTIQHDYEVRKENGWYMDAFQLVAPLNSTIEPFSGEALTMVLSALESSDDMNEFVEVSDNETAFEKLKDQAWLELRKCDVIGDVYAIGLDHYDYRYYESRKINHAIPEEKVDGAWIPSDEMKETINWHVAERFGYNLKYIASKSKEQGSDLEVTSPDGYTVVFSDSENALKEILPTLKGNADFYDIVREECRNMAECELKDFNDISEGNIFGVCVEHFIRETDDEDGEWIRLEAEPTWGYIGEDGVEEELKSRFDAEVKHCLSPDFIINKHKEQFGSFSDQKL